MKYPLRIPLSILMTNKEPQVKREKDLKGVTLGEARGEKVIYEVYRDVEPVQHYDLRADVTVLRPCLLSGGEFCRTHGHVHPEGPWEAPWPEVYVVLKGSGKFLLHDEKRAYLVEVKEGDVVRVPEGMAHVLINDSDEALVTLNFVSKSVKPDYEWVRERGGPALFLTPEGPVKNEAYELEEVKLCRPLSVTLDSLVIAHSVKPSLEEWLVCFPYKLGKARP